MRKEIVKRRKNNKGFSLVELIIVIAIMAILVGILAPQFIKYVEKSRKSTDVKNAQEIVSAIQVYAADDANTALTAGTVTITKTATAAATASTSATIDTALADAGITTVQMKSLKWGAAGVEADIVISVAVTDGTPTFTVSPAAFATASGITVTP